MFSRLIIFHGERGRPSFATSDSTHNISPRSLVGVRASAASLWAPLRCEPLAVDNVRAHPSPHKDECGLARTTCLPHWRSSFLEQHLRCYLDWHILWSCVRSSSSSTAGLRLTPCYSLFGLSIHQAYRYYRLDFGNGDSVGMKLYVRHRNLSHDTPVLIVWTVSF